METELHLLKVYLGVHPDSDSRANIEKRIVHLEKALSDDN